MRVQQRRRDEAQEEEPAHRAVGDVEVAAVGAGEGGADGVGDAVEQLPQRRRARVERVREHLSRIMQQRGWRVLLASRPLRGPTGQSQASTLVGRMP